MRLASYNVENLFQRANALNGATWDADKDVLEKFTELNGLFNRPEYTAANKARIVELLKDLGLAKSDDGEKVVLRQNKGKLLVRHQNGQTEVVAAGRSAWVGWLDLKVGDLDEVAIRNTARVITDVNPDVLAVCEVESRPALVRFSEQVIPTVHGEPFEHAMLIDGNDDRGIDVGILTRAGYTIDRIRSHVDDEDADGRIFSRDCVEYVVRTGSGKLVVLVNHLKSKGFGGQEANDKKRRRQAVRVKTIYEGLRASGVKNIAVVGDFNDVIDNAPLAPLKQTDLRDISAHPKFVGDGRPGTFANGTKTEKIDYILLSPALFDAVTSGGINRKGVWGGAKGDLFPHYPEITKAGEAASDHAAIFADLDI